MDDGLPTLVSALVSQTRALSRSKAIKKRRVTTIMVDPKKESAASFLRRMKRASSSETVLEAVKADSSNGKRT